MFEDSSTDFKQDSSDLSVTEIRNHPYFVLFSCVVFSMFSFIVLYFSFCVLCLCYSYRLLIVKYCLLQSPKSTSEDSSESSDSELSSDSSADESSESGSDDDDSMQLAILNNKASQSTQKNVFSKTKRQGWKPRRKGKGGKLHCVGYKKKDGSDCDYSTNLSGNLIRHIRTHTGT